MGQSSQKSLFSRLKNFVLKNHKGTIENRMPQIIFIYVIILSALAASAAIFKLKFAFFLHVIQVFTPLLGGATLLIKRTRLKNYEWYFVSSLLVLGLTDAGFYFLMYMLQLKSSDPLIEAITIVPYLLVYLLASFGLWLGVGKKIIEFPVRYLIVVIMVPFLLSMPTFYQILKSGAQFIAPVLILQICVLYTLMTLSLFALIVSKGLYWNTVALGMFCFGLTDLSIMIEHFLRTVVIESINTYLWTFASLAFSTPFILSISNNDTEVLPAEQNSIVLQARIWLVSGVTIPAALFSLLGRGYQIMSFTSLTVLLTTVLVYFMTNEFLRQLQFVSSVLGELRQTTTMPNQVDQIPHELKAGMINLFIESLRLKNLELEAEQIRRAETARISKQVAHDIRSPLSALNIVAVTLDQIPEERRLLIRSSIQRINDIANSLLQTSKSADIQSGLSTIKLSEQDLKLKIELLPALTDTIISEKRMQFRDQINVSVDSDFSNAYGAFAHIDRIEFKRVISNLINNSVESFPNQAGKVLVSIRKQPDSTKVVISDNGKGIPKHILEKLGEIGVSHGKNGTQSGSGLGVYHAKKTIEASCGKFHIESQEGKGTTITMTFPNVKAPDWFIEKLILPDGVKIVSVDDDLSIHEIWKERAQSLGVGTTEIELLTFTSGDEFKKWFQIDQNKENIYLVDYELLNQPQTGLDLIEELGIGTKSVLVTSRYEEEKIRTRCQRLGVKLIPKTMSGFVPIEIDKPKVIGQWV